MISREDGSFRSRVRCLGLRDRIMAAEEAAKFIRRGMTLGCSGFTPAGYAKVVPLALAERAKKEGPIPLTIWTGASVGPELDAALCETGCIARRYPYQGNDVTRKALNAGEMCYQDYHLSEGAQNLRYGFHGKIDVAVIEATAVTEEGYIVPTTSVGCSPTFVQMADKVIVEINTTVPEGMEGLHDIYMPKDPPHRAPIPIRRVGDVIGKPWIRCPRKKIVAIVPSDIIDKPRPLEEIDSASRRMAGHLLDFLQMEVRSGRIPKSLLPLQSGVGNVANAVLAGLKEWPADGIQMYTEVVQDAGFDLLDSGKVSLASTTCLAPEPSRTAQRYAKLAEYKGRLILRPQEISNSPEVARRLGIIALNTALEADIYGQVNSTCMNGSFMMNGIGGSGDFARSAYLSVFLCPSTTKKGAISKIVPMCTHVDHTEHDVDVIVTEQGLADLRNLCPRERSREIIRKCASEEYRSLLTDYVARAERRGGHEPHLLEEAFAMQARFHETGSMK